MCASLPVQVITAAALLGVGEPLRLGSLSDTESMRNGDGSDDEDEDGMQGTGPPSSSQVREFTAFRHALQEQSAPLQKLCPCSAGLVFLFACCRESP
jgi:hypothetical protein